MYQSLRIARIIGQSRLAFEAELKPYVTAISVIGHLPEPIYSFEIKESDQPPLDLHYFSESPRERETISMVPKGELASEWLREHAPDRIYPCHREKHAKGNYRYQYQRIREDSPAFTLTTYFNKWGCGPFVHPTEDRMLTLREGALIQGFPKGYRFFGSTSSVARQIGNAVPVPLAEAIARSREGADFVSLRPKKSHRLVLRRFADATDNRTAIASIIPPDTALGDNAIEIEVMTSEAMEWIFEERESKQADLFAEPKK